MAILSGLPGKSEFVWEIKDELHKGYSEYDEWKTVRQRELESAGA